jgi:hypothetical protein
MADAGAGIRAIALLEWVAVQVVWTEIGASSHPAATLRSENE